MNSGFGIMITSFETLPVQSQQKKSIKVLVGSIPLMQMVYFTYRSILFFE